nr:hypothetical protein [Phenylobacterium sp.]
MADGGDPLDADDGRAVDADEPLGVELGDGPGQRLPDERRSAVGGVEADVVALGIDQEHAVGADPHPRPVPEAPELLHIRRRFGGGLGAEVLQDLRQLGDALLGVAGPQLGAGAAKGGAQPGETHRLQQIGRRPAVIPGLEGVMVEGGDEDHDGWRKRVEPSAELEPVQLGHLDVEQQHIGLQGGDAGQGVGPAVGLAQKPHAGHLAQHQRQPPAGQRLVVDDEDAQRGHANSSGRVTSARNPRRGWAPAASRPASP